ncbi:hypothetical protein GW17_00021717 [Ensete ventricosum]|nr:hypothetical protein GW17_00021717 [Ensete ventricosum]
MPGVSWSFETFFWESRLYRVSVEIFELSPSSGAVAATKARLSTPFMGRRDIVYSSSLLSFHYAGEDCSLRRYPRPDKEYQSFSLIYNERSLDLICKDKDEAEAWFVGLKALISLGNYRKLRSESKGDRTSSDSPTTYIRKISPFTSPFSGSDISHTGSTRYRYTDRPVPHGIDLIYTII